MAEINWDKIRADAYGEGRGEPAPINVDEENLALSSVVLVDRRPNSNRLRSFVPELPYVALGYNARESAELQGLSSEAVSTRRRMAREEYHVATTAQLVVASIQAGHINFAPEVEPKPVQLTAKQRDVLHMTALGYSLDGIAEYLKVQPDRVQTHYEMIRQKLGARNMKHAMLRAFALGIFELGRDIETPEQLEARSRLVISVADKEFGTNEAGILEPAELELLETIGALGASIFDREQLMGAGFLSDIESKADKDNKYARTMGDLRRKINLGAGITVLDRGRIAEQRVYMIREAMTIYSADQSFSLPACTEEDIAAAHRAISKNRPRIPRRKSAPVVRPRLTERPTVIPRLEPKPLEREKPKSNKIVGVKVFADD